MEFGIFDFYKVFSKALGEEDGAGGTWMEAGWCHKAPHSRVVVYLISQATEVALTIACPNRSRVEEYND